MPSKNTAPYDLTTEEGVMAWALDMVQLTREEFETEGQLGIETLILGTQSPQGKKLPQPQVIQVPIPPSLSKEIYSRILQSLIKESKAIGVLFISESWYLSTTNDRDFEKYPCLGDHPDAQEMIYITLEHKSFSGMRVWQGFITRDSDGKGHVAKEFKYDDQFNATGRFAQLLRPGSQIYA